MPGFLLTLAMLLGGPAFAQESVTPASENPAAEVTPADPELAGAIEAGQKLYMKNCRTCHGTKGTAGVPLAKNAKVQADYGYLVWAILTGPGYMPEFGPALSDDQISKIATYILNSWGNDYGIVTPQDVHDQR
jgi:mono/diheme cytochrome c family protein